MSGENLELDLSRNRLGDCWMVLSALGTAAVLRPEIRLRCVVPQPVRSLAEKTFEGRFAIVDDVSPRALTWSHVGLRGMLPGVFIGRRYVAPYPRIVAHVRKLGGWRNSVNQALLDVFDTFGRIFVPPVSALERPIGFIQLVCLPPFRNLGWDEFANQAEKDFVLYRERVISAAAALPVVASARERVLVFSSGVSQQSMPPDWAKANINDAVFSFHRSNPQEALFREAGLEIVLFDTPEELVRLALDARWVIATDSFPSHVLQLASDRVTLCLTQELSKRVVSPFFRGTIVEPCVPCAPCAGPNPNPLLCRRGFRFCLTWGESRYREQIVSSIH